MVVWFIVWVIKRLGVGNSVIKRLGDLVGDLVVV